MKKYNTLLFGLIKLKPWSGYIKKVNMKTKLFTAKDAKINSNKKESEREYNRILNNILDKIKLESEQGRTSCTVGNHRSEFNDIIINKLKELGYKVELRDYSDFISLNIDWNLKIEQEENE